MAYLSLGVDGELSWFNYQTEAKLEERKRTREVCHEGIVTVDANFVQSRSTIYLKYDLCTFNHKD